MTNEEVAIQVYNKLTRGGVGENKTNLFIPNIIASFPECRRRFIAAIKATPGQEDKYYRVTTSLTVSGGTTSISALLSGDEPILFEVPFLRVKEASTGSIIQYFEDLTLLQSLPIVMDGYAVEGTTLYLRKYDGTNMGDVTLTTHKIPSVPSILEQHIDMFIDVCVAYWSQGKANGQTV